MTERTDMMERSGGVALWRQIAERLRIELSEGVWQPGTRLPPEWALAERFGVNRHTVRRAIAALGAEGLLRPDQGRGTFVEDGRFAYPIARRTRFSEIVSRQAREPDGRLISQAREAAERWIVERLALPKGSPVLRLETLHVADGVPMSTATNWFSAKRFPNLVAFYAETGSITRSLAAHGVEDYLRRSTRISARRADAHEIERLALLPGATVLVAEAINVDMAGQPIQFSRTRFAADRVELVVESDQS